MFSLPQISSVYLRTSLIPFLGALYILHKMIITNDRHFQIIYIVALLALVYKFIETNQSKYLKVKYNDNLLNELLTIAKSQDKIEGNNPSSYHIARYFLHGDAKAWKALQQLKPFEKIAPNIYNDITSDIVQFYEKYGFIFKQSDDASYDLNILIDKRNKIMNKFQHLELKMDSNFTHIIKTMRKINFNILVSLNNCIKIISKKYRANYKIAPIPANLTGTNHELF